MFAALETSLGKQGDSRLLAIGTGPADDRHWFAGLLDGGADYAQAHVGTGEPYRRRTWEQANPSLRSPAFRAVAGRLSVGSEARQGRCRSSCHDSERCG